MTAGEWLLLAAVAPSTLYWSWGLIAALRTRAGVPTLGQPPAPEPQSWPRVSVIVPARDEAAVIEAAVRSRLADDYVDLELIVVDDRSTDGTADIIDRIAAEDARVRPLHLTEIPDGWLGKVNALEQGRRMATGEWLLFSDADVTVKPGALREAVAWAEANSVDHLCVLPALWPGGFVLDAALSGFWRFSVIAARLWQVPDPRSTAFAGMGAWNQVRRSAFDATTGFEWLRMAIVDDVALGRMIKLSGATSALVNGCDLVGLHLYESATAMTRGIEKNAFALIGRYQLWRLAMTVGASVWADLAVLLALVPGVPLAVHLIGGIGLGAGVLTCLLAAQWMRRPMLSALAVPLASLVLAFMVLRSGWVGWRRGGVTWRGTFYPNAQLRGMLRMFD